MKPNTGELVSGPALILHNISATMAMYYRDKGTLADVEVSVLTMSKWAEELNRMAWWLHEQGIGE